MLHHNRFFGGRNQSSIRFVRSGFLQSSVYFPCVLLGFVSSVVWFAQITPSDTRPTEITWANVIFNAGAFGLLAYIVVVQAPKVFREVRLERQKQEQATKDEREARDKAMADERALMLATFSTLAALMQDKFEERNNKLISATEKQTAMLINQFEKDTNKLIKSSIALKREEDGK